MKLGKRNIELSFIRRILFIPLIAIIISIMSIAYISSATIKKSLLHKMQTNGINMAQGFGGRIEDNQEALAIINKLLNNKILAVANIVKSNEVNMSNEELTEMAKTLDVRQINWYDNSGKVIYSSGGASSGLQAYNHKSGYLRTEDGELIQVVIEADNVERFGYQALIEDIVASDDIAYAYFLDEDFNVTYHNDEKQIARELLNHEEMQDAILRGEIYSEEFLHTETNMKIYHVAVPLIMNNKVVGILNLGYSMDKVQSALRETSFKIYTLGALLLILLVYIFRWLQKKKVIAPILELDRDIQEISLENDISYRLPIKEEDPFNKLRKTTNSFLNQTQRYFESMIRNQEELEGTLSQIKANERLLMGQYDEISRQNKQIKFAAHHDDLTGLPNRRVFTRILKEKLKNNNEGAIMLLDIDNFKNINDALGHGYGDKVLQYVGDLLEEISCEKSKIYRFGGDEFLVNIDGIADSYENSACLKSILECFKTSHWIEGVENYISLSIGIVCYPQDGKTVEELLKKVDIAMYSAKKSGKDKYLLFGEHMTSSFLNKIKIEKALRKALEQESFKLLYQPVIDIQTGEIEYFEALIRMEDSEFYPGDFIPIAEETRLILPIGRWVIKEAMGQIRKWKDQGYDPKTIAINLSPKQMEDTSLVEYFEKQIIKNNIDPSLIEIEITEGILLENKEKNIRKLDEIKDLGMSISLDDFGSGYSSLNSLTYIPVDKVKIDKSLKDKFINHESNQVLDGIISLMHALDLKVVIEGVEDLEEVARLETAGSDYLQGYLFSRPIPSSEVEKIFNKNYLS